MIRRESRGANSSCNGGAEEKKYTSKFLAPLLENPRTAYPGLFRLIPIIAAPFGSFLVPITSNQRHDTMAHAYVRTCVCARRGYRRGTQYRDTRRRTGGTFLAIQFLISCPDPGIKGPSALLGRSSARFSSRDLCAKKKGCHQFLYT